jgi:glycosyltransferase EpsD
MKHNVTFERSPLRFANIRAYFKLKKIIRENNYSLIHCHTPMGGVLTRLAGMAARKKGTKIIYTAHGFHFFKGAPLLNWLIYYPIEKWLSKYTDCLITINEEDYNLALERNFGGDIRHVHGVGVDLEKFKPITLEHKRVLRNQLGFKENDFLLFYAAEFNANKNQQLLIRSLAEIIKDIPNAKLLLAGHGPLLGRCMKLAATLNVSDKVHFLGYRKDIIELLSISDVVVASSKREGLPVNILEAMASGLPVIATDVRGHRDLIKNGHNGYLVDLNKTVEMSEKIRELYHSTDLTLQMGRNGISKVESRYCIDVVVKMLNSIYEYTEV